MHSETDNVVPPQRRESESSNTHLEGGQIVISGRIVDGHLVLHDRVAHRFRIHFLAVRLCHVDAVLLLLMGC